MVSIESLRPTTYSVRYPRWMAGRPLLYTSAALASLGDALFGYSQGITAAFHVQPNFLYRMFHAQVTEQQIQMGHIGVNPFVQSASIACLNVTAFFASFWAAYISDILGRRMAIRVGAAIYFFSALIQIFAMNLATLIAGRAIQGVGVGVLAMTVPVFQIEISPPHARGLFISIEYLCLNTGYLASAWVGYAFYFKSPSEISWRGPFIVQAALALLLFFWSFILPETPRWLIQNGFEAEGLWTLADLHGAGDVTHSDITASFHTMIDTIAFENKEMRTEATWKELFTQYARRTIIGITSQMFAQLNGINAILHFLPENLDRAGFAISESLLYSGACAILYCAGTIPTMFYIDKLGRRLFLLIGSVGLAVCLSVVGGLQFYVDRLPVGHMRSHSANSIFAGVGIYLFVFGATWGPVPWLLGAEIFPVRARAKGSALSNASDWFFNFIMAMITPLAFDYIPGGYYFILVGSSVVSFFFVWAVYPETAHKTLEELGEVFGEQGPPKRSALAPDSRVSLTSTIPPPPADADTLPRRCVDRKASAKLGISRDEMMGVSKDTLTSAVTTTSEMYGLTDHT